MVHHSLYLLPGNAAPAKATQVRRAGPQINTKSPLPESLCNQKPPKSQPVQGKEGPFGPPQEGEHQPEPSRHDLLDPDAASSADLHGDLSRALLDAHRCLAP